MKKMNKQTLGAGVLATILILMMFLPTSVAQTNSLAVFENCADGALVATWTENATDQWAPQNSSGDTRFKFNCTGVADGYGTVVNTTAGHRWFGYTEVQTNDTDLMVGPIFAYNGTEDYLCVLLDQAAEKIYIAKWNGSFYYFNSTDGSWEAAVANGTDYDSADEQYYWEYASDYCLMKWIYNSEPGQLNFKAWTGAAMGNEPTNWLINITHANLSYSSDISQGLFAYNDKAELMEAYFRRIMFWNLTYELNATDVPQIPVPLYDAYTFATEMAALHTMEDSAYNTTVAVRNLLNKFDLESFMRWPESLNEAVDDQNDSIYVYSIGLTDFSDAVEESFSDFPDDFTVPDNLLYIVVEDCTDGSDHSNDYCLLQFDCDNDGTYEDWEKSYYLSGNYSTDTYDSFTGNVSDGETSLNMFGWVSNSSNLVRIHRFDDYKFYHFLIDPSELLLSDGGSPVGVDTEMGFSLVVSNYNETGDTAPELSVWQGWDESDGYLHNESTGDPYSDDLFGNATTEEVWGVLFFDGEAGEESEWYEAPATVTPLSTTITDLLMAVIYFVLIMAIVGIVAAGLSKVLKK